MADADGVADGRTPVVVPVICGPTASGKSSIAMWLSQRREITVISADSRQIYRHFDVGTAKPTPDDQRRVPHRGIDVVEPTARYSAADWTMMAQEAIGEAVSEGRMPVVVGGTGFYISALFRPLFHEPELDPTRRTSLQRELETMSVDELRRWCESLDPARASLGRTQLLRAIEVALLTGVRLSTLHVQRARPAMHQASYLLVDPATELPARIAARASAMLAGGGSWIDEVRSLSATVPENAPAWRASGYEAVRAHVLGRIDRAALLEQVVIETRQYAKRQRTWFRHQLEPDRVTRLVPGASGWQEIVEHWITGVEADMQAPGNRR